MDVLLTVLSNGSVIETFSDKEYVSKKFYCIESEFIPTYDVQIKTFEEPVKQEQKEFILTTLKQIGAA